MEILQDRWKKHQCLIINGIVFEDGRILQFDKPKIGKSTLQIVNKTDLQVAITELGDYWTTLIPICKVRFQEDDLLVESGQGGLGEDGYVAVSRASDNHLVWLAFFDYSNPFYKVSVRNAEAIVVCETTYGDTWQFHLNEPDYIEVDKM